jgi:hypothetical protein
VIVADKSVFSFQAFAALVKLGTVSISGSITTIITLLNKPENICAAVTMLGKTCELCGDLLVEKVRVCVFACQESGV